MSRITLFLSTTLAAWLHKANAFCLWATISHPWFVSDMHPLLIGDGKNSCDSLINHLLESVGLRLDVLCFINVIHSWFWIHLPNMFNLESEIGWTSLTFFLFNSLEFLGNQMTQLRSRLPTGDFTCGVLYKLLKSVMIRSRIAFSLVGLLSTRVSPLPKQRDLI